MLLLFPSIYIIFNLFHPLVLLVIQISRKKFMLITILSKFVLMIKSEEEEIFGWCWWCLHTSLKIMRSKKLFCYLSNTFIWLINKRSLKIQSNVRFFSLFQNKKYPPTHRHSHAIWFMFCLWIGNNEVFVCN